MVSDLFNTLQTWHLPCTPTYNAVNTELTPYSYVHKDFYK